MVRLLCGKCSRCLEERCIPNALFAVVDFIPYITVCFRACSLWSPSYERLAACAKTSSSYSSRSTHLTKSLTPLPASPWSSLEYALTWAIFSWSLRGTLVTLPEHVGPPRLTESSLEACAVVHAFPFDFGLSHFLLSFVARLGRVCTVVSMDVTYLQEGVPRGDSRNLPSRPV